MKSLLLIPAFALPLLAACDGQQGSLATYACPNGPSLVVAFSDDAARITFPSGRVEELAATETEGLYAKPGVAFDARVFRTARLTDGPKSFNCDQLAG